MILNVVCLNQRLGCCYSGLEFGLVGESISFPLNVSEFCWRGQAHEVLIKLAMILGTWCMDKSIVTGSFLYWNNTSGN